MILASTCTLISFVFLQEKCEGFALRTFIPEMTKAKLSSPRTLSSRLYVQQWQPPTGNDNTNSNQKRILLSPEDIEDPYVDLETKRYFDGTKPDSGINLAVQNFKRQGATIIDQLLEIIRIRPMDPFAPPECLQLSLSNEAVTEAERRREEAGGGVDAHPVSRALYDVGCLFLDRLFDGRPIERFWFLEIIARIPYFTYVSMLHLYESLGWFRACELRKVHAAEDWNELHHLLIMESLGGNRRWSDRFLGYHVAIVYYWVLVLVYLGSPRIAYQFMELLEAHAVDTYTTFINENRSRLAALPAPKVAKSYYTSGDLYLFDDFQVSRAPGSRRPPCETLLETFINIATDEGEHVKTMIACQNYSDGYGTTVVSPHLQFDKGAENTKIDLTSEQLEAIEDEKRALWKEWSAQVNNEWR
ncbi:alternative oxidase-domain containing protein [Nitzschia inconspicua]|uniref:Alternative oxidase-domain containing protein n=1 Tax=Nitzschia inconspicua TaxID=303405 RepID=A0A9K3KYF8_9STRA|nr:alternative oxidase-domain containing protein [Nitzschia inconspicua]